MKKIIVCLLLLMGLGIMFSLSFGQQTQNSQRLEQEIGELKKQVMAIQNQLQIVENIEKMELAAKLAEAEAKLLNADFDNLKSKLRDSNHDWLRGWILLFLAILSTVGIVLWSQFKSKIDQLIENEVEKSLNGFKEAIAQVNTLKNQLGILEKEHAASILENFMDTYYDGLTYPQSIEALREEALLQVFDDNVRRLAIRYKAAEILVNRGSPQLVAPLLKFLNSAVDLDFEDEPDFGTEQYMHNLANFLGQIGTPEAYKGLKEFLNRLLTKNLKQKDLFLTQTASSLARVGVKLEIGDAVLLMRKAIPDLRILPPEYEILSELGEYFDMFNQPDGIKEILYNHLKDEMLGFESFQRPVEARCLELLQNAEFVKEWQAQKETANTQSKESS